MSSAKAKATPQAGGYTGVVFRNRRYPNHRQRLPALGEGYSIQFRGGTYVSKSAEEEAELRKLRKKGIAPYNGIPVYECGLCRFASTDEEEVKEHRQDAHSLGDLLGGES